MSTDLTFSLEAPLAWLTLDRLEKRNAVTHGMWVAIEAAAQRLSADGDHVRVALVRGAGVEAFSAGADIQEMRDNLPHPQRMRDMQDAVQRALDGWAGVPQPTVAVIRGACTGGGCALALACDLRLATPESFFMVPPARLGLVYSLADTKRLVDAVGIARARELLFSARRIGAEEALQWGLVQRIVPGDRIEQAARELALDIARNAQSSVRAAKRVIGLIAAGASRETAESRALYDEAFFSPDFHEGAQAFMEKRPPRF